MDHQTLYLHRIKSSRRFPLQSKCCRMGQAQSEDAVANRNEHAPAQACTEAKICSICVSEPTATDLASINGCHHVFCFDCIEQWAYKENSCPLCKARFNEIARVHPQEQEEDAPPVINVKPVESKNQGESNPSDTLNFAQAVTQFIIEPALRHSMETILQEDRPSQHIESEDAIDETQVSDDESNEGESSARTSEETSTAQANSVPMSDEEMANLISLFVESTPLNLESEGSIGHSNVSDSNRDRRVEMTIRRSNRREIVIHPQARGMAVVRLEI